MKLSIEEGGALAETAPIRPNRAGPNPRCGHQDLSYLKKTFTGLELALAKALTPWRMDHRLHRNELVCWEHLAAHGCKKGDACHFAHPSETEIYSQLHDAVLMVLTVLGGFPRGCQKLGRKAIEKEVREYRRRVTPQLDDLVKYVVSEKGFAQVPYEIKQRFREIQSSGDGRGDAEEDSGGIKIIIFNEKARAGEARGRAKHSGGESALSSSVSSAQRGQGVTNFADRVSNTFDVSIKWTHRVSFLWVCYYG